MILAFIGKGGVGKTTVSSAVALNLSQIGKTVLVSSDFMPCLQHVFPKDPPNLKVVQLREREVAERWKKRYGEEVAMILNEFVEVDDWIIDHIASSPGVAEEFLISNIVDLEMSGNYDYVIWDTAASSATMHLLFLEREFYSHLDRDVKIFLKIRDRFRSQKILKLLEEWKALADRVWEQILLSKFFIVTTPDELCLLQTEEISLDLKSMGINEPQRIYNRSKQKSEEQFGLLLPELSGSASEIVQKTKEALSNSIAFFTTPLQTTRK